MPVSRSFRSAVPLLFVACGGSSSPVQDDTGDHPSVLQDLSFTVGARRPIPGTPWQLHFVKVRDDSRCPMDVVCVRRGEAVLEFALEPAELPVATPPETVVFHDDDVGMAQGLAFEARSVRPLPRAAVPIDPASYRVTLRVSSLAR